MEHRIGIRTQLSLPVRLDRDGRTLAFGRLRNASVSGAYIETFLAVQVLTPVEIVVDCALLGQAGLSLIAAYVTRVGGAGVAVEWHEFAPTAIRRLLLNADAEAARTGSNRDDGPQQPSPVPAVPRRI